MKKILKPGKTINRELTCSVCGCVFTYELVDVQEELIHSNISLMFLNNITKKYVTCPHCGHKIYLAGDDPIDNPPITYGQAIAVPCVNTQELNCETCPNKPDPDHPSVGDTPCTWCKKRTVTCTCEVAEK